MSGFKSVEGHLKEKLKDPAFRELYELEEEKAKIAAVLVKYRVAHRLTQGQLARRVGVTQQHIAKIEQGDFSSLATIQKVLLALGYHVAVRAVPLAPRWRRLLHALA